MFVGDTVYVAMPRHVNSTDFDQPPNNGWHVEWYIVVSFDNRKACLVHNGHAANMIFVSRSRVFLTMSAAQEMADYHRDQKHTVGEICIDAKNHISEKRKPW